MKTLKSLTFGFLLFLAGGKTFAASTSTYTLVHPCQPFAIITPIPGTYGCFSFSVTNSAPADPNAFFSWNFGDGSTAIGNLVYHCYSPVTNSTNFTVSVSYNSAALCGPVPTTASYTVTLNPPAQNTCVQNTPSVTLSAKTVTVWSGVAIPEIIYKFSYGDATSSTGINTHTYQACGNYIITVKNWDMNGTQDTCYAYAAVNIACSPTTGIEEKTNKNLPVKLYPNPATDVLSIDSHLEIISLSIWDLTGRTIFNHEYHKENNIKVDVSKLPEGAYFIGITVKGNSEKHMKFIKQ